MATRKTKAKVDTGFRVRFRGVRGSFPAPGKQTLRYGGNTSCVEVRAGGHLIICDAGTGIIGLGEELARTHFKNGKSNLAATILMSHSHHDHYQGFPFFIPAYMPGSTFHIFGPRTHQDFEKTLHRAMLSPLFPVQLTDMRSEQVIQNLEEGELIVLRPGQPLPEVKCSVKSKVRPGKDWVIIDGLRNLAHPNGGVINFRIRYRGRTVIYATDIEGYVGGDKRLVNFATGADVLIHDAQYTEEQYYDFPRSVQGFGHSTHLMAAEVGRQARVKQLVLFHHDPSQSDQEIDRKEREARTRYKHAIAAHEGLELKVL